MLDDYTLRALARERQERVRNDVAHCRRAGNLVTCVALLSAFATTLFAAAYSSDRTGTFSGVVLDDRQRPVSSAAVFLTAMARRCATKTDRAGRFAVDCAAGGGYTARVHKSGFVDSVLPNVGTRGGAVVDAGVILLRPDVLRVPKDRRIL